MAVFNAARMAEIIFVLLLIFLSPLSAKPGAKPLAKSDPGGILKCLLLIQTTTTTTRPVLEQRVYNERVTAPVHPEPVQPVHSSLVTSKVTTENTQMRTENHELRMKVADLQMRVDRLLKGRDQVEAEGSGRFQFISG